MEDSKLLEYRVNEHDVELKEHAQALRRQGTDIIKLTESIDNLTKSLQTTMSVVKWFIGVFVVEFIGFFFYVIQTLI